MVQVPVHIGFILLPVGTGTHWVLLGYTLGIVIPVISIMLRLPVPVLQNIGRLPVPYRNIQHKDLDIPVLYLGTVPTGNELSYQ